LLSYPSILPCTYFTMGVAHTFAMKLSYYMHRQSAPLHDLGYDLIPEAHGPIRSVSEHIAVFIVATAACCAFLPFFVTPPPVRLVAILLRVGWNFSVLYWFRIACFLSTGLPGPGIQCRPGAAEYDPPELDELLSTPSQYLWPPDYLGACGDLIPSGHCILSLVMLLAMQQYLPLAWFMDRWRFGMLMYGVMWPLFAVQLVLIIATRKHYTVDVVVACFVCPLVWKWSNMVHPAFVVRGRWRSVETAALEKVEIVSGHPNSPL